MHECEQERLPFGQLSWASYSLLPSLKGVFEGNGRAKADFECEGVGISQQVLTWIFEQSLRYACLLLLAALIWSTRLGTFPLLLILPFDSKYISSGKK